jgi:hypothetical protein
MTRKSATPRAVESPRAADPSHTQNAMPQVQVTMHQDSPVQTRDQRSSLAPPQQLHLEVRQNATKYCDM